MERPLRGDIVVINFPYSDLATYKKRPVFVVKVPKGEDIIVCQITSTSSEKSVEILLNDNEFEQGKLKMHGNIRIDKIFSVEKSMIDYKIGYLKKEKIQDILDNVCLFLKS